MQKIQYIHDLGALFEKVQLSDIFPDSKTFPDCVPKASMEEISLAYNTKKNTKSFDLKAFVYEYFDLPIEENIHYRASQNLSIDTHIEILWDVLGRSGGAHNTSLIPLPNNYIVPGGRFREVYYWDSYFTMLGLKQSGRYYTIECMLDNFAYLLQTHGLIPNGNRAYYLGRSQPPFFSLMVDILAEHKGAAIYDKYLDALQIEFNFWENKRAIPINGLGIMYHYDDDCPGPRPEAYKEDVELSQHSSQKPETLFRNIRAAAESGWDFSTRWFAQPDDFGSIETTNIVPVDLNCLIMKLCSTLSHIYLKRGQQNEYLRYKLTAEKLAENIEKLCWNEAEGFYFDYNYVTQMQCKSWHLAGCFPLFFEIAPLTKAQEVAKKIAAVFLKRGGLVTSTINSGQQWDAPNGWAPLQWMCYKGLRNYEKKIAAENNNLNPGPSPAERGGNLSARDNPTEAAFKNFTPGPSPAERGENLNPWDTENNNLNPGPSPAERGENLSARDNPTEAAFKNLTPGPSPAERGENLNPWDTSAKRGERDDSPSQKEKGLGDEVKPKFYTTDGNNWKKLHEFSKENRKNKTKAEDELWQALRNKKIGFKFRRQHIVDDYIVDFINFDFNLVIEVDGPIHEYGDNPEYDLARTKHLESLGYRVIRFQNEEVLNSLTNVINIINEHINECKLNLTHKPSHSEAENNNLSPGPSPAERGEKSFSLNSSPTEREEKGVSHNLFAQLAKNIRYNWLNRIEQHYIAEGKLTEKYNVIDDKGTGGGEYPNQDGFGWTNGVYQAMKADVM